MVRTIFFNAGFALYQLCISNKETYLSENLEDSPIKFRPEFRPEKLTSVGNRLYRGDDPDDSSPEFRPENQGYSR